ncbi:Hypothetical predicted protein [Olea europaea subsp. europaea]|uniref:Uncharacterized protein n=1 Tax=Olea europaea subsp. europaea TaxID=158383 RepID=A0A8S0TIF5_OLEEU|nr:Hypothetical predicted protein [Olea europaea subsp. europaea]
MAILHAQLQIHEFRLDLVKVCTVNPRDRELNSAELNTCTGTLCSGERTRSSKRIRHTDA